MKIYSHINQFNADIYTPVNLYLSLRNNYRKTCLLESNDYNSRQDSKSYIGLEPILEIKLTQNSVLVKSLDKEDQHTLHDQSKVSTQIQEFLKSYEFEKDEDNGFFGRMNFELTHKDETNNTPSDQSRIPMCHFFIFRYVIVIDHFTNDGQIIQNSFENDFEDLNVDSFLQKVNGSSLPFETIGNERMQFTDKEFEGLVKQGIKHCEDGDVFQIVLSNEFEQSFFGDDFQVYRELRRLNPSPYLFYFDFEDYRLFGSSPEAQIVIKDGICQIHPIAGTVPRTGVKETDDTQLNFLLNDEKENAEHTMLVDLARNDLSRDCDDVKIERYKEVQNFSHVTHLVSKVRGQLKANNNFETLCHSFPAGTLSGTPKPMALKLIHAYEQKPRDFYGGTIGLFSPHADLNMAIVIRSILSKNNTLHYRAGAGVVLDSIPSREAQEVHHKLRAVRKAIQQTQEVFTSKISIQ